MDEKKWQDPKGRQVDANGLVLLADDGREREYLAPESAEPAFQGKGEDGHWG